MIHEEVVTCEVAKLAKEKGFDWGCLYHYDCKGSLHQHYAYDAMNSGVGVDDLLMYDGHLYTSECLAPTQSLLQRWLREEKGIQICIDNDLDFNDEDYIYEWQLSNKKDLGDGCFRIDSPSDLEFYPTYEEALTAAMKYALENLI